jgi:hypothetical protein
MAVTVFPMSLDWTLDDWRERYFGRKGSSRRLPRGYRSHARDEWDEELRRAEERERWWAADRQRHIDALHEREQIVRWTALVERFGAEAVVAIARRTDPNFELPAALREE